MGIQFENTLTYTEDVNAYLFKSFYNGSGVALSDLNEDGNLDLFFCGNQVSNKLYIGDGKFNFVDATKEAGLESDGSWTTGVSVVDINGDGWKDLYVCKSGPLNSPNRRNQLFINKGLSSTGQITFIDSAKEYGIDDLGFSIQATFFDYDKDGDLDMYLSSNSPSSSNIIISADQGMRQKTGGGSKLYNRQDNHFIDVTAKAGLYNSPIGFGLGIATADVNRDGWPDLYVANDFFEKDYLYLNQHDGTFKESIDKTTEEISQGSMGVDISDMNHDGLPEIFVTEMLPDDESRLKTKTTFDNWDQYQLRVKNGYHKQFPRNTFQLNRGRSGNDSLIHFSEISRYSNLAATDWSWGVEMADFDNDGEKEIFVTNGIGKDFLDRDFLSYYDNPDRLNEILHAKGRVITELFDNMPSKPIPNCLFKLDSDLVFKNVTKEYGLDQPSFSSSSAYGDIDNDGDLDLVVNNVNAPPFIYKNQFNPSGNHFISMKIENEQGSTAIGAQVSVWTGGKLFFEELYQVKGAMSTSDDRLLIGIGKHNIIDSVIINWPVAGHQKIEHISSDQFITIKQDKSKCIWTKDEQSLHTVGFLKESKQSLGVEFSHKETDLMDFDRDDLLFGALSNEGPKIAVGDVNGDGKDDFFIGGAKGQEGAVFQQQQNGFKKINLLSSQDKAGAEQQHAVFFDADNDGDQDLVVASGSYEFFPGSSALTDVLYLNDGKGNFHESPAKLPVTNQFSTSIIIPADFDNDGDMDLFVGSRYMQDAYGLPASSYLLNNNGKGVFTDITKNLAPGLLNIGLVTDAVWTDFDADGDPDLLVVGEWMPVRIYANNKGQFKEVQMEGIAKSNGLWNTVVKADLDGDGDDDYVLGNSGNNTFLKPTDKRPLQMYVNDFDRNGNVDQIVAGYKNGKLYPLVMKDVLTKRIPSLQKKYLKFSSYQGQTIEDIFPEEILKNSVVCSVYVTATCIAWNDTGKLSLQPLPFETQLSSTYAISVADINKDGKKDIILGGNQYCAKPQTGIYAGSYGNVLINKGNRQFEIVPSVKSGFFVTGQIRDIQTINYQQRKFLLVTRNNDSLETFEFER